MIRPRLQKIIASFFFVGACLAVAQPSQAIQYVIVPNTTSDAVDGTCNPENEVHKCSLREAIMWANANSAQIRIELEADTYELTRVTGSSDEEFGDLDIDGGRVTIVGPEVDELTNNGSMAVIDANSLSRHAQVFSLSALTLENVVLKDGAESSGSNPRGGSVRVTTSATGSFAADHVLFLNNSCESTNGTCRGGAVFAEGNSRITIENSQFEGNSANGENGLHGINGSDGGDAENAMGGALYLSQNPTTLQNTTFVGNSANGGTGGNGGSASQLGGDGGDGSQAHGGAIYFSAVSNTSPAFANLTFVDNETNAGAPGTGGTGNTSDGSDGAVASNDDDGSAIYIASGNHAFEHITVVENVASDGDSSTTDGAMIHNASTTNTVSLTASIVKSVRSQGAFSNYALACSGTETGGYNVFSTENAFGTGSCGNDGSSDTSQAGAISLDELTFNNSPIQTIMPTYDASVTDRYFDVVPVDATTAETDARGVARPEGIGELKDQGAIEMQDINDNGFESAASGGTDTDDDGDGVSDADDCDSLDSSVSSGDTYVRDNDGDGYHVDGSEVQVCPGDPVLTDNILLSDSLGIDSDDANFLSEVPPLVHLPRMTSTRQVETVRGSSRGRYKILYDDGSTQFVTAYENYSGDEDTVVKYHSKREQYMVYHPNWKFVVALDGNGNEIGKQRLARNEFNNGRGRVIGISQKRFLTVQLRKKKKSRLVMIRLKANAGTDLFGRTKGKTLKKTKLQYTKKAAVKKLSKKRGYRVTVQKKNAKNLKLIVKKPNKKFTLALQ